MAASAQLADVRSALIFKSTIARLLWASPFRTRSVKVVASPRNHLERTVASAGGGGRFLLGEGEYSGQCSHEEDLALSPLPARMDFHSINKKTDYFYNLRKRRLI